MAANLILALVTIAGLGILALCLIFFGGNKKTKKIKNPVKETIKPKQSEEKLTTKQSISQQQHKEPFISNDDEEESTQEAIIKTSQTSSEKLDPAIASLGFSAIDDLLIEPESSNKRENKVTEKSSIINTPAKFNSDDKKKLVVKDILVLHVMAPDEQPFVGYELLQAMTAAGLRFGKMDIFHRYDDENPEMVLFSLCSAVEPGVFDIANIGALYCPGLSLFMRVSAVDNPKVVFNLMLETANLLASDLAGYVCDEKRQKLTEEKLHEYLLIAAKRNEYV